MIADFVGIAHLYENDNFDGYETMTDLDLAIWYKDSKIYPDKVRLICYYYRNYSFKKILK